MKRSITLCISSMVMVFSFSVFAESKVVDINVIAKGKKIESIGSITFSDSKYGLLIKPSLTGLSPGSHGFHLHVNPSCDDNGMAAGGHFDPERTNAHKGPYDAEGHLGDMPVLFVDQGGKASTPLLAPRLTVNDITGHAVMIHAGGDNYSDQPEKLGGGGARFACGVIQEVENE